MIHLFHNRKIGWDWLGRKRLESVICLVTVLIILKSSILPSIIVNLDRKFTCKNIRLTLNYFSTLVSWNFLDNSISMTLEAFERCVDILNVGCTLIWMFNYWITSIKLDFNVLLTYLIYHFVFSGIGVHISLANWNESIIFVAKFLKFG